MKTIILLRHAKSSWGEASVEDFDRSLNPRGERAASLVGQFLRHEGLHPDIVLCSAARRTRETLVRVQGAFGEDVPALIERDLYLASTTTLLDRLRRLSDDADRVLVIGHNPGLEDLAATLIEPQGTPLEEKLAMKYPTAGLAVLSADIGRWHDLKKRSCKLDLFVIPKDLV